MSRPKYAAVTSDLLVRKGEARPWQPPLSDFSEFDAPPIAATEQRSAPVGPALAKAFARAADITTANEWRAARAAAFAPAATMPRNRETEPADEHPKHCRIKLSAAEYERLGIVAVKKELTRHQILRQAIEHYLTAAKQEYRAQCGCLGDCRGAC